MDNPRTSQLRDTLPTGELGSQIDAAWNASPPAIHLIPIFSGDLPDPRGGVRWPIPERAGYWSHRG